MGNADQKKAKHAAYMREWSKKNPERKKELDRQSYERNREARIQKVIEYKKSNPEKEKVWDAAYRARNSDKIKAYNESTKDQAKIRSKLYYSENKDSICAYAKKYYQENKEQIAERNAAWHKANRDRVRVKQREYVVNRLKNDPVFHFVSAARRRMSNALSGVGAKSAKTVELLGCTGAEAVAHIESKFKEGMSWSNRREWHIDHIRPLVSFDLSDPAQQKIAFHFSNLQPLWAKENRSKGARWVAENV